MNIPVPNDRWFATLPAAAPDMDSLERPAINRGSCGEQLSIIGERRLEISQERQVIGVWMVGIEP